MGKGRGKQKGGAVLVVNKSERSALGIHEKLIQPGQMIELTAEEVENPGVAQWMRKGILGKIRRVSTVKRLVRKKPRILVAVHTLFRGGAETATIELHRQLKSLGCEQALLNLYVGEPEFQTMLATEARGIFDIYNEYKIADKNMLRQIIRDFAEEYNPDVVMYSLLREVPESLLTLPDKPPVIQVMQSELGDSQWGYDPLGTDAVVTVSHKMAESIGELLDIPSEKLFPIWNGVDPQKIFQGQPLHKELGIDDEAVVVGMVGNLNDLKRPLMGLEAFSKVRKSNDHMIFAGNPADMGNEVNERIIELDLREYVHVLGLRNDVENVYATIDIMLNCSTSEGLPMSISEAMFARVSIIASAVGGNPEIVLHGKTGYIFAPEDQGALNTYLARLMGSYNLRRAFGYEGYLRAVSEFHIEGLAKQYLELIRDFTLSPEDLQCSIIMPVWNGEKWLDRAIWSVRRQTFPEFEFIIVDDGSTDDSRQIVERHMERDRRIKLVKLDHGGIVKALNAGIKASALPIIARMDADDEMVPNRLELQMEFMNSHREIDVCGTQMLGRSAEGIDRGPMIQMPLDHAGIAREITHRNPMCHPTVMFRRQAWEKVGGYKGDGRCEDWRMWAEMLMAGCRFANLREALLIYQHTHEGDQDYAKWRDSVIPDIKQMLQEGAVVSDV